MTIECELTGNQVLSIWWLALSGGECWNTDMKPEMEKRPRDALVAAGIIKVDKRQKTPGKGPKVLRWAILPAGRVWAAENLGKFIPNRDNPSLAILRKAMTRLNDRIAAGDCSFDQFFGLPPVETDREPNRDLKARIVAACERLTDGVYESRIRLADIRDSIPDAPREQVDRSLWELVDEKSVTLFRLDRFNEITPRDEAAALETATHDKRHILYLARP